jgi:outer membrane protein
MKKLGILLGIVFLNVSITSADVPQHVVEALKNNTGIKNAQADLEIAKAQVEQTYGMFDVRLNGGVTYSESLSDSSANPLFPSADETTVLGYNLSLSRKMETAGILSLDFESASTNLVVPNYTIDPIHSPGLSLSYQQPLMKGFLGRPDRVALKIAAISIDLAEVAVLDSVIGQVEQLIDAYYFIDIAKKILVVQKISLSESEAYYAQTLRMKRIGLRENKDVLQTKASKLSAQSEIAPAENNVQTAIDGFLNLAKITPEQWERMQLTEPAKPLESTDVPAITEEQVLALVDQQPTIKMSVLRLDMMRMNKSIVDNDAWPELNIFGKYGMTGSEDSLGSGFSEMFSNEFINYAVGLNFTVYLPNRSSSGEISKKTNELEKAQESYEDLRQVFRLQIRRAHRSLVAAKEDYQFKVEARELYEKTLSIQNRHFSQGRISTRELLMAQGDFHRAQFSEISSYFEFIKALNVWRKLNGEYNTYSQAFIKE